jgi:hypothetical protein
MCPCRPHTRGLYAAISTRGPVYQSQTTVMAGVSIPRRANLLSDAHDQDAWNEACGISCSLPAVALESELLETIEPRQADTFWSHIYMGKSDRERGNDQAPDGQGGVTGPPDEQEIEAALFALLRLTQGGLENARKVIRRAMRDAEAARLIAAASWGTVGGVVLNASGARAEGRNLKIDVQIRGIRMTFTPQEWVQRVRHMFSGETSSGTHVPPDVDYSDSEESISPSADTK